MKKITSICFMILFSLIMASCQFPGTKIQPGDKIGDMEFINDYEKCPAPNYNDICGGFQPLADGTCEIPPDMPKFWISTGWSEETEDELEWAWDDAKWSLTFDGYKVDLPAFGTFDMVLDGLPTRAWNVCINNPKAGKHTVVYKIHFDNGPEPGNHTWTHIFTVLANDETQTP
jgi:hypothetical protein